MEDIEALIAGLSVPLFDVPMPSVEHRHRSSEYSSEALKTALFERVKTLPKAKVTETIRRAVSIGLMRGNIRRDQLERTSEAGKAIIYEVSSILGIKIRVKGVKLVSTNKTLTFSRMISLFPHLASQMIISNESLFVNKYASSFINANRFPAQSQHLPKAMLHTGFSGLIPRESEDMTFIDLIFMCHTAFMAEFSFLINPRENRSFHAMYDNQKTYSEAARGSGLITDEDRIVYLLAFGLLSSDSLDKMLTVADRVLALNGSQSSVVVTRNSFTIVEDRVKIVKDDAKWQELLEKANKIARASSSMSSAGALQVDVQDEGAGSSGCCMEFDLMIGSSV